MKKNQNGFTLIELLVTIALMLSILGVAIVSFIGISDRKKEDAWQDVKAQVETAAIEYFSSNEYLFEALGTSDNVFGSISIGKLVDSDYISKVTNPITGKTLPNCAYVKVQKEGNKYKATLDDSGVANDDPSVCDSYNSIEIGEARSPEFTLEGTCRFNDGNGSPSEGNNDSDWCYQYDVKPIITNLKGAKDSSTVKYCVSTTEMCQGGEEKNLYDENGNITTFFDNIEGKNKYITVTVDNGIAVSKRTSKIYNIDRTPPKGTINISPASEKEKKYSYNVKLNVTAYDDGIYRSGLESVDYKGENVNGKDFSADDSKEQWTKQHPWEASSDVFDITGDHELKGDPYTSDMIVKDKVGNQSVISSNTYSTYSECSETNSQIEKIEGQCDCDSKTRSTVTNVKKTDKYTGNSCGIDSSATNTSCNPTGCSAVCPTITYSAPDGNNGYYKSGATLTIRTNDETDTWDWYVDAGSGYKLYSNNKGTKTKGINGNGTKTGKIVVRNSSGNSKTCYTKTIRIDGTAPNCPAFSYSGTKGDNGWYTSRVYVTITPTSDTTRMIWGADYYNGKRINDYHTYGDYKKSNNTLGSSKKEYLDFEDSYVRGRVIVYDEAGNQRNCYTNVYKIDKTAPTMSITYGPKRETCGSGNSVRTKYTVKDSISGLSVVKDFYGYDSSIPSVSSSYWRNRSITSGQGSYSHDHNWGPYCSTKGNPGSGTCYKLKYYLKDVAGNVRTGMTSSCATYYKR